MPRTIALPYTRTIAEETGFLMLAALIGLSIAWTYARHTSLSLPTTVSPVATASAPTILSQSNTWPASDGAYNVIVSSVPAANNQKQYTVNVTSADGKNTHTVLSALLPSTTELVIPYNAWSPDDQYLFLEKRDGADVDYLVMRADGTPIQNGNQFMSVKDYFNTRNTGNTIHAVTGWASSNLLIITTEKDAAESTSYWIDVPNGGIIPLATRF